MLYFSTRSLFPFGGCVHTLVHNSLFIVSSVFISFRNNWSNFRNFIYFISILLKCRSIRFNSFYTLFCQFLHCISCMVRICVYFDRKLHLVLGLGLENRKINFQHEQVKQNQNSLICMMMMMIKWMCFMCAHAWQKQPSNVSSCYTMTLRKRYFIVRINSKHFHKTLWGNSMWIHLTMDGNRVVLLAAKHLCPVSYRFVCEWGNGEVEMDRKEAFASFLITPIIAWKALVWLPLTLFTEFVHSSLRFGDIVFGLNKISIFV